MAFTPMFRKPFTQLVGESSAAAVQTYQEKVVALSPIAYWPLTEASGTAAVAVVGTNGTYARDVSTMGTGDGPIAGQTAPVFDGTNDFVNIYSAGLNTAYQVDKSKGTLSLWAKVSGAGVWTDGAQRQHFSMATAGGSDRIWIYKLTTNNSLVYNIRMKAVTVGQAIQNVAYALTTWVHYAMTWDKAADQMIEYWTGAQTGATQSGLQDPAVAALLATTCCIGAGSTTPTNLWSGLLSQVALFQTALTPAQIATLATP